VSQTLVIFGASTRAAAFSARRAGLSPWCADLFADSDLRTCCPVQILSADRYPEGFADLAAPEAPWIYTGGLENYPALVSRLARSRPLWGNDAPVLRAVRSPATLYRILRDHGIPCPPTCTRPPGPRDGRWLVKPVAGAGGAGIRFWAGRPPRGNKRVYYQQFIEGDPCSAVYVGARLIGASVQLIGEPWLHARPFQYCGSLSGLPQTLLPENLARLGTVLAEAAGLRGLFGVDFIQRDGVAWPVEINPRYTASVEVVELAQGMSLLANHCRAFDPAIHLAPCPRGLGFQPDQPEWSGYKPNLRGEERTVVGKAILFARAALTFPADGPWQDALRHPPGPWDMPRFADIPHPGDRIEAGRPVLTFFAAADSHGGCRAALQETARDLDRRLYGG
jgi:predicted ATP-grasp superfamily ATP-dependent carboligase